MTTQGIAAIFCFVVGAFGLAMWARLAIRHRRLKTAYRDLIRTRRA